MSTSSDTKTTDEQGIPATMPDTMAASNDEAPEVQVYMIYIDAPAQKIWDAVTTAEFSERFGYGGVTEIDLTPGGAVRDLTTAEMRQMGMGEVAATGTVIEVDPPRRLVMTWSPVWQDEPETTLTYEIKEYPGGASCFTLTHVLTGAPNTAKDVRGGGDAGAGGGGWPWVLSSLKTLLETDRVMPGAGA
ncbi:MAG: SRPBCC domain-containing protein [Humibacillus sp.]|nr:SRPBCC domain-containing protein [Humibacillus sp.]MDN5778048.1 SRPBCC domain-containing protein [Humibacillus sp.]